MPISFEMITIYKTNLMSLPTRSINILITCVIFDYLRDTGDCNYHKSVSKLALNTGLTVRCAKRKHYKPKNFINHYGTLKNVSQSAVAPKSSQRNSINLELLGISLWLFSAHPGPLSCAFVRAVLSSHFWQRADALQQVQNFRNLVIGLDNILPFSNSRFPTPISQDCFFSL